MKKRSSHITIAGRKIGSGNPCFIVAEVSANHGQDYHRVVRMVKQAAASGVDAVKLQTYTPDTMTIDSHKKWFLVGGENNPASWKNKNLYDLYKTAYTPWEWQPKLKKLAERLGILLFSTPFDASAVDFLERMRVSCYKVASYELTDIPLLKRIARTRKPVILSVGFGNLAEIALALKTLRAYGAREIAVLHCVTGYSDRPKLEDMNLSTIMDIRKRFGVVAGFSDNNAGIETAIAAAAYGASIIEKHFILDRRDPSPDARFSITPAEMKLMVETIRGMEKSLGRPHYGPSNATEAYNKRFRRSLFVVEDVKRGERFTLKNVRSIRPAFGLPPKFLDQVIGKTAKKDITKGTPLRLGLIR